MSLELWDNVFGVELRRSGRGIWPKLTDPELDGGVWISSSSLGLNGPSEMATSAVEAVWAVESSLLDIFS